METTDWQEIGRAAPLQQHGQVVTTLTYDTSAELLWVGSDQGYVHSFNGPELRRYTSFRAHALPAPADNVVRQILCNDRGIVSLAAKSLHMSKRGGPAMWNLLDPRFDGLTSMAFTSRGTSEVLVGGSQLYLMTVNLDRGTVGVKIDTDEDVKIMKRSSRNIITASSNGNIRLLDMSSYAVLKQFDHVHSGMILDIDSHDNYLVTCGYSLRQGTYIIDPLVKVFDLRASRALPPVSYPGASFIRMHPKMSASAIIGSTNGQFQVVDIMNPGAMKIYNAAIGSYLTMMELSPSGEVLALLDAEGYIQMWSSMGKRNFTEFGTPVEWPKPVQRSSVAMDDNTYAFQVHSRSGKYNSDLSSPLNMVGMPYFNEPLLSNWDPHVVFEVPKHPAQRIDLETMATVSVSGYAPFHRRHPRNYVDRTRTTGDKGVVAAPKFLSQQSRDRSNRIIAEVATAESKMVYENNAKRQFEVPPEYKKLEIKYSKFGIEDFDFAFFNSTKYSGLETNIPNSYMNPLLQLYRYTPRFRNVALVHTASYCIYEECILCQFGFLFDMLEKANGLNCQATNFLKTLSSLPNAARHGVLEEDSSATGSATMMMQTLNRFLLDQTIFDFKKRWEEPGEAELPKSLMIRATKRQQCLVCHKETRPLGDSVTTDLVYSAKPVNSKAVPSFAQVVRQSIQLETTSKGWCDKCRRYQTQNTKKSISKLPDILTFNVTTQDKSMTQAKDYWSTPGWLPDELGLTLNNKCLNVWQGEDLKRVAKRSNEQAELKIYELVGFVAEVREEDPNKKHMVSLINVAISSEGRAEGDPPKWHLFNDFHVRPVTREEALDFTPKWKMPSVLCFQLKSSRSNIDNSWKSLIDPWILFNNLSYNNRGPEPETEMLTPDEVLTPGSLVALDAEFVEHQKEENEIKADGNKVIVRPVRLGLGRVSVLRGAGHKEGTPFIDDYIATKEAVVDYVTEFSGLHPGDLDPATSPHHLVSLKVAYKRLWILLNSGVVFVGHGLLKDFRIINIHVPQTQVVDTVNLYVLPQTQRKLSLRFLAWAVFKDQIQIETHDSIVDARTALRLYRKYLEYVDAGILEHMFDRIYADGLRMHFKPPAPPGKEGLLKAGAEFLRSEGTTPVPGGRVGVSAVSVGNVDLAVGRNGLGAGV